jgi:GMP synthase-like glutamine amidotransferase
MVDKEIIIQHKYNQYQVVYCFFYTRTNEAIKYLLTKHKSENYFSPVIEEIIEMDVSPIFTISRSLATKFNGLLCKTNLDLLYENKTLTKENLREPLPWYKLYTDEIFIEWLHEFSENIVQYDLIDGKMIYFYELKEIDISQLNCLTEETGYEFKYFTLDYENRTFNEELSQQTNEFVELFDFNKHINETEAQLKDDSFNKYIVLSCNDKRYEDNLQPILRRALFQGLYKLNNEKWLYYCVDDELPGEHILSKTKAILIPGSPLHLYNNPPEKEKIKDYLRTVINDYKHIKLAGFCYGHQVLAYALDGEVQYMNKTINYIEEIEIDESFWDFDFVKNSGVEKQKKINIFQFHSDQVTGIPDSINLYGSSETCKTEIFVSKDQRIFSVQGHPEYSPEYIFFRLHKHLFKNLSDSKEDIPKYAEIRDEYIARTRNRELGYDFRKLSYSFIKSG